MDMGYAVPGAIIILGFFGLLFGIGLAIAARKFGVEVDPRVEQVLAVLPNANCGACGYPGCSGFAKAVVAEEVSLDGCPPGGQEVADEISKILGKAAGEAKQKLVAIARCNGGVRAKEKFIYEGIADCRAAKVVADGQKMCAYACLGFGTCVQFCPFNALSMSEDGLPVTDFKKCTGCGICVDICPNKILELIPENAHIFVACNSKNKGAFVRKVCETGCIACMLCQKNCPQNAIVVKDNLARIDYEKCTACGVCIEVCPTNVILNKFEEVLTQNDGIPVPITINPEETKQLLDKIKQEQKKKKESAKAKAQAAQNAKKDDNKNNNTVKKD